MAANDMAEVEVWVMVDEDGDYEVSKDADDLQGGTGAATRLIKIRVLVPKPRPVELVAEVQDEPQTGELKVAG